MRAKNFTSVGALHPILFFAVMYIVVLFFSIFICSSLFYSCSSKQVDDKAVSANKPSHFQASTTFAKR